MAHEGTTCSTSRPAANFFTTWKVAGSISQTSPLLCGTYTIGLAARVVAVSIPGPVAAYTSAASVTGGMPGSPSTAAGGRVPDGGGAPRAGAALPDMSIPGIEPDACPPACSDACPP